MMRKAAGCAIVVMALLVPSLAQAAPAIRSISVARIDTSSQQGLDSLQFQQTILLDFPGPLTLTGGIGATHELAGSTEYRPSLGGAWVLPGNFYLDGWYSMYIGASTLEHGVSLALNFETDRLYVAARESIRFGEGAFSSVAYLDGSWTWIDGSSLAGHAALGITSDARLEPAGWAKASWRATNLLAPQLLASMTQDATGLNESVGIGCAFYFGLSNVSASWEPRFGSRAGESSINVAADLRF